MQFHGINSRRGKKALKTSRDENVTEGKTRHWGEGAEIKSL